MESRLSKLVSLLGEQKEALTIARLAELLNVSERTIYSDVEKINFSLKKYNVEEIQIQKGVIEYKQRKFANFEKQLIEQEYFSLGNIDYRRQRILESILLRNNQFTVEELLNEFDVSRNTILSDLKEIKTYLTQYDICLESTPFKGYKITGEETQLRWLLVNEILNEDLIEPSDLVQIEFFIKRLSSKLGIKYSEFSFQYLVLYFWVSSERIKTNNWLDSFIEKNSMSKEELTLFELRSPLEKLFKTNNVPNGEISYLASKISEASIVMDEGNLYSDKWHLFDVYVQKLIGDMTKKFPQYDFLHDKKLYEGLINHLRPAYKRAKTKQVIENPLYDFIKEKYPSIQKQIIHITNFLQPLLNIKFSEIELSFFTLFFAASIERQKIVREEPTRVAVICNAGLSTSEILKSRLISLFGVKIVGTFGSREGIEWIKKNTADLIVTTVPLDINNIPVIKVSAFLSDDDIELLGKFIRPHFEEYKTENLLSLIKKHIFIPSEVERNLLKDLDNFLKSPTKKDEYILREYQPMLREIVNENLIEINYNAETREEAVRECGRLLVNNKLATNDYIDGMIENLEENGTYIVIAPEIAMPHARPEKGALAIGFSIVTLANPVKFGHPKNDPVQIVIGLCAIDHQTHLMALAELVEILSTDENVQKIKNATDKSEILNLIRGGE